MFFTLLIVTYTEIGYVHADKKETLHTTIKQLCNVNSIRNKQYTKLTTSNSTLNSQNKSPEINQLTTNEKVQDSRCCTGHETKMPILNNNNKNAYKKYNE